MLRLLVAVVAFGLALGANKDYLVAGDFLATNSVYETSFTAYDPGASQFRSTRRDATNSGRYASSKGAVVGGSDIFVTVSANVAVNAYEGNADDLYTLAGNDANGGVFSSFESSNSSGNYGIFFPSQFDVDDSGMDVSGSTVFQCGRFNIAGATVRNNAPLFNQPNAPSDNARYTSIASFTLSAGRAQNLAGTWKFIYPDGYPVGGANNPPNAPRSVVCNTIRAVGTNGAFLIRDGTSQWWRYSGGGWAPFTSDNITNYAFRTPFQSVGDSVYVVGRNMNNQWFSRTPGVDDPQLLQYAIWEKPVTASGAGGWTQLTSFDSRFSATLMDSSVSFFVGPSNSLYLRYKSDPSTLIAPRVAPQWAKYWHHYVVSLKTSTGTAEWAEADQSPLGGRLNRFVTVDSPAPSVNHPSVCTNFDARFDFSLNRVVAFGDCVNWLLIGDVEKANDLRNVSSPNYNYQGVLNDRDLGQDFRSYPLNRVAGFDGTNFAPVYGGGLSSAANQYAGAFSLAQTAGAKIYFPNANWGFDTWSPYVATFDDAEKSTRFWKPLDAAHQKGLAGTPHLGTGIYVSYARFIKVPSSDNKKLLVSGQFGRGGQSTSLLNSIAFWDGSNWEGLPSSGNTSGVTLRGSTGQYGSRAPGRVTAIVEHNGIIYVGGSFDFAGDVPVNSIAQYDIAKGTWSRVADGITGDNVVINHLWVHNDEIWAAGRFNLFSGFKGSDGADDVKNNRTGPVRKMAWNVVRFNPSDSEPRWKNANNGISRAVQRLVTIEGNLYAFQSGAGLEASGISTRHFSVWTGDKWQYVNPTTFMPACARWKTTQINFCALDGDAVDAWPLNGGVYFATTTGAIYFWNGQTFTETSRVYKTGAFSSADHVRVLGINPVNKTLIGFNAPTLSSSPTNSANFLEYAIDQSPVGAHPNYIHSWVRAGQSGRVNYASESDVL